MRTACGSFNIISYSVKASPLQHRIVGCVNTTEKVTVYEVSCLKFERRSARRRIYGEESMEKNLCRRTYGEEPMEKNLWRWIYEEESMKKNLWRRIYGEESMEKNLWRRTSCIDNPVDHQTSFYSYALYIFSLGPIIPLFTKRLNISPPQIKISRHEIDQINTIK